VHPFLLWTSPAVAGLMVVAALGLARSPLLERGPRGPRLSRDLEGEIVATAAELPAGTARDLFAGMVRLARFLTTGGEGQGEHHQLIGELVPVACRGARELARLDEELRLVEAPAARQPAPGPAERAERGEIERRRDLLVQRFLETEAGLKRLIAASAGGDGVHEELRVLTGALERDAAAWEAAEREVARVVG
jgi:hypothetical protein